ncbi:(2Fe-2S)-binding protein [Mycobacterium sp. 236(2023)]|uniref:(2Fe-2S)-binding protein n=1 Tax=Mycobacterium sp. 236(2023) TaxID=3038163 RepID=UPI002414DAB5|nr:(2Fe-2S)-binding protein [Mycobacterium sp. 236(2023)]MDG4664030.1 (2Fe-2S)-binding protein [Mycobacterium sp. 236(2023)]
MERRPFPGRVERLGEYFTLTEPHGAGWRPMAELDDDTVWQGLVAGTRRAIAIYAKVESTAVPARVAASSLHLSTASRLLSPVIGTFAVGAGIPLLTADVLRWRTVGHSVHFAASAPAWRDALDSRAAADLIDGSLVASVLAPIIDRLSAVTALSTKVMWGNLMSAANGAVTVMGLSDSELASAGQTLVRSMLELPHFEGTATLTGSTFRRRNCCLFYLAPGGGLCGDCVLNEARASH